MKDIPAHMTNRAHNSYAKAALGSFPAFGYRRLFYQAFSDSLSSASSALLPLCNNITTITCYEPTGRRGRRPLQIKCWQNCVIVCIINSIPQFGLCRKLYFHLELVSAIRTADCMLALGFWQSEGLFAGGTLAVNVSFSVSELSLTEGYLL